MITQWDDKEAEKIFRGEYSKKLPTRIQRNARKKLIMLDSAMSLEDLKIPPSNRLHPLVGKSKGKYSISINMQWRIIFKFENNSVTKVKILDYH